MEKDFLVVDFEFTTYTKPVGKPRGFFSEIIEIGAVKADGDTYEITDDVQNFVKPHFYPKQASEGFEFAMITEQDMEEAVEFADMIDTISSLYTTGQTYFVAWGDADYAVLDEGCRRHRIPNPVLREDYLDLAVAYKFIKERTRLTSLKDALEEQGIGSEGFSHTAYDDAENTFFLMLKLIDDGWKPQDYFDTIAT